MQVMLSAPNPSEVARFIGQIFSNIDSTTFETINLPELEKIELPEVLVVVDVALASVGCLVGDLDI
jgi:hypothetical protein